MNTRIVFAFLLFPTFVFAQNFPDHPSLYVNDHAHLLSADAEKGIIRKLKQLKYDTGVEATVLTIDSHKTYGHNGSIEQFATALFNRWEIGDANQNNGILILIERNEREMRIELGHGYNASFDRAAQNVIDQSFLPAFRKDRYEIGIVSGTDEVVRRIAKPFATGKPAPKPKGTGPSSVFFPMTVLIAASVLFSFKGFFSDQFSRFRRCPNCGQRTLSKTRHMHHEATKTVNGERWETTCCSSCGYNRRTTHPVTYVSIFSGSGVSFGGGRSSGGGASGGW